MEIRGSYQLENLTASPIDSVHVATAAMGVETRTITFDRPAALAVDDAAHGHRTYTLERLLLPGETLRLDFDVKVEARGFSNRGIDPAVAATGSSFTNAWFPLIGYQRQRELISAGDRRQEERTDGVRAFEVRRHPTAYLGLSGGETIAHSRLSAHAWTQLNWRPRLSPRTSNDLTLTHFSGPAF